MQALELKVEQFRILTFSRVLLTFVRTKKKKKKKTVDLWLLPCLAL